MQSITFNTGAKLDGRGLARNGGVTMGQAIPLLNKVLFKNIVGSSNFCTVMGFFCSFQLLQYL